MLPGIQMGNKALALHCQKLLLFVLLFTELASAQQTCHQRNHLLNIKTGCNSFTFYAMNWPRDTN